MKWSFFYTSTFLNSACNAGRSLVNPLFIAAISFLFIRGGMTQQLQDINKISALINLFLVFSGWGLKDYLVKESARPYETFRKNWHLALYSKLVLLVPLLSLLVFFPAEYLPFILLIALLRTFNAVYEPLVVFYKRNGLFFLTDLMMASIVIILIAWGWISTYNIFFYVLMAAELLKVLLNVFVFRLPASTAVPVKELLLFLKDTRFYFLLVLLSFFQSRVDLYLLGFLFSPDRLNEYQLLSSLISLAQVIIASFVISYSRLIYRDIGTSAVAFRRLVLSTGLVVAIIASVFIGLILTTIYRFNFSIGNSVIVAGNIMAFAWTLFEMYYYTRQNWLNKTLLFVFISGLANFALSLGLIPILHISGALLCNTLAMMVLGGLMWARRIRFTPSK